MDNRANVRNLRFRYTKNEKRIIWTKGLYPYARYFLNLITSIPWHDYKARLESYITLPYPTNHKFTSNSTPVYEKVEGNAVMKKIPYSLFGGTACEILNAAYPESGNLHATTDPTADIDVSLEEPLFIIDEERDDYEYSIYRKDLNELSPLGENYFNWLFDRIAERLPELASKFSDNPLFETPLPENTDETSDGIRYFNAGPFLLTLLITDTYLIKIQITTTYSGITDHIVEFVMGAESDKYVKDDTHKRAIIVGQSGIAIEDPFVQLGSQLEGLVGRQEAAENIKYKLINHYGRIMYLVKAIRWLADNSYIKTPTYDNFNTLLKAINKGYFERGGVCPLPIGCSLRAIVDPIRPYVKRALGWHTILKRLNARAGGGTRKKVKKTRRKTRRKISRKAKR